MWEFGSLLKSTVKACRHLPCSLPGLKLRVQVSRAGAFLRVTMVTDLWRGSRGAVFFRSEVCSRDFMSLISASLNCSSVCKAWTWTHTRVVIVLRHRGCCVCVCVCLLLTFLLSSFSLSLCSWCLWVSSSIWACLWASFSCWAPFRESLSRRISPFFNMISSSTSFN